ncbi:MAG TPA: hypothetical protein VF281_02880 [Candidatus Saccharimonadales bacterium]
MYPNDPTTPPEQPEQPSMPALQSESESTQPEPAPAQPQAVDPVQQPAVEPQQPAFVPQQQPSYQAPAVANPGKGLGIAGFILAFFVPIVGLPLSIVAFLKSKKANMKNGLALAGIILNSVFLVVGVAIIAMSIIAFGSLKNSANTQAAATTAQNVVKMAEMYDIENSEYVGDELVPQYPKMYGDISSMLQDTTLAKAPLTAAPTDPAVIAFYACGDQTGNKVEYWDYTEGKVAYAYAGEASDSSTDCTLVTE